MGKNMGIIKSEDIPWKLFIKECNRLAKIVHTYK